MALRDEEGNQLPGGIAALMQALQGGGDANGLLGLGGIELPGEKEYYANQLGQQTRQLSGTLTADRQLALNDLERRGVGQGSTAGNTFGRFNQALGSGIASIQSNVSGQQFLARERRIASALDYLRQRKLLALQSSLGKKKKGLFGSLGDLAGTVGSFVGLASGGGGGGPAQEGGGLPQ